MADVKRKGDREINIVDPITQDIAEVTTNKRLKVDIEGSAETSLKVGTRLKIYENTWGPGDSPVTYNIKADMDTKYGVSDSQVRFFQVVTNKTTQVAINGDTEKVTVKANEVFNLNNFDIVSVTFTITSVGTELRILAEGL